MGHKFSIYFPFCCPLHAFPWSHLPPHLQRSGWAQAWLLPVMDFGTYAAIVVQLLPFAPEKLRKQPCSHVAAVAKSAGATLVVPLQAPAQ